MGTSSTMHLTQQKCCSPLTLSLMGRTEWVYGKAVKLSRKLYRLARSYRKVKTFHSVPVPAVDGLLNNKLIIIIISGPLRAFQCFAAHADCECVVLWVDSHVIQWVRLPLQVNGRPSDPQHCCSIPA